ncbi:Mechanosensitive ion channel [Catalinimonas alkaloidigena]|uniref:Mechanosensitive ion channel n=1 Tax=Catalinimonas alkaloidigena TaxID=1075417 RepID=A0A1G9LYF0_9BACT|nr:mechanosensitive ion channel family protein [Catalinimonas alkaloidigena]SDL67029.1 Mechanosensitive ion channel [Catalinimonas alkaloidigena]
MRRFLVALSLWGVCTTLPAQQPTDSITLPDASAETPAPAAEAPAPGETTVGEAGAALADSLLNQRLTEASQQLQKSEQQRMIDSLQKVALERELALLKSNDNQKRRELQERIRQIEVDDSLRQVEKRNRIEAMKQETKGFPVAPFGDTLFYIFTKIGPFTPQERATNINHKIRGLYESGLYKSDDLHAVESESSYDLVYGETIVMSMTDWDALWQEMSKEELAQQYRAEIDEAVLREIKENSLQEMIKRVGEVVLVLVCILLLFFILNKLFRLSGKYIERKLEQKGVALKLKEYEFLSQERLISVSLWLNNAVKTVFFLLSLYLALPIIFSIFKSTRGWANLLLGWILAPVHKIFWSIIDYLPNLFTILVTYLVVRYVVRAVRFMAREIATGKLTITGFHPDWAMPTFNLVRILLYAFMFIVIFPYLPGSGSPVFQGVSVFLGILFSLGSSSAISNAVAGMVITYMRPFRIGDRIKIGEISGDVIEKNLLVTRIRTIKNEEITVPNSSILSGHTINYTTSSAHIGLVLHATVTIGYDVPWKNVHQALIDAALRTDRVLKEPAPFVLQTGLEDFYVSYQINAYTANAHQQARTYSGLFQNIQDVFNERGIEILSPHYRAQRDGNMTTIPADYLPKEYQAPPFRISHLHEAHPTAPNGRSSEEGPHANGHTPNGTPNPSSEK